MPEPPLPSASPLPNVSVLPSVSLARSAGGRDILGAGWCEAEPGATWTGDVEAVLRLPLPPGTHGCTLRIEAAPYRRPGGPDAQRVLVLAGERLLGRMRFEAPGAAELAIPADATTGRMLRVSLVLPDARRPAELGESGDARLLGLFVGRIALLPAVGAGPGADHRTSALPGRSGAARGPSLPARAGTPAGAADSRAEPPARALLGAFESLGWNEEFGFVQRRFLAEPAGLLRWASTAGAAVLAEALECGLYGIGDPGQLAVEAQHGAWVATDRRWGFRVETQVALHQSSADALRDREARAQAMLRARLLATLRDGQAILVHKERGPAERPAAAALAQAIAGHGGCWLLWVRRGPAPAVCRTGPRRLEATLPRLSPFDAVGRVAARDWLAVCREAWRLSRDDAPGQQG